MGQLTPTRNLPYPDPVDVPDVPSDIERLARAAERELDDNRHAIETVGAEVTLVKSDLQAVKSDIANVKREMQIISDTVVLIENDVDNLEQDVASLDQRVDILVGELVYCGTYNADSRKIETLSSVAYSEYKDPVPYGYGNVLDPLRPQNNKGFVEVPAMAWNAKHFFIVSVAGPTMNPDGTLLADGIDQPGSTSPGGPEAKVDKYEVGDWILSNGRGVLGRINPLTGVSENVNIVPMMPLEANSWLHMSYSARFALASSINVDVAALNTATGGKTPTLPAQENTVQKALAWFHTNKVSITGDTMIGNLIVRKSSAQVTVEATSGNAAVLNRAVAAGTAYYYADAPSGQYAGIVLRDQAGKNRWVLTKSNAAETGANAGADLTLLRYDDAGIYIGGALTVSRATGLITVAGEPTLPLQIATMSYADKKLSKTGPATFTGDLTVQTDTGLRIRNSAGQSALLKAHASNGQFALRVEDGGTPQLTPVAVGLPRTGEDAARWSLTMERDGLTTSPPAPTSVSFNSITEPGSYGWLMNGTSNPDGPGGGYCYVHTYCYAGTGGNRTQIAIPYRGGAGICYRDYYGGEGWSAWRRLVTSGDVFGQGEIGVYVPINPSTGRRDWNFASENGLTYMAEGADNAPQAGGHWWIGRCVSHNPDWKIQEAWQFTQGQHNATAKWTRCKRGGTWHGWHLAGSSSLSGPHVLDSSVWGWKDIDQYGPNWTWYDKGIWCGARPGHGKIKLTVSGHLHIQSPTINSATIRASIGATWSNGAGVEVHNGAWNNSPRFTVSREQVTGYTGCVIEGWVWNNPAANLYFTMAANAVKVNGTEVSQWRFRPTRFTAEYHTGTADQEPGAWWS